MNRAIRLALMGKGPGGLKNLYSLLVDEQDKEKYIVDEQNRKNITKEEQDVD